ncbi:response regulator receiver protein [Aliarcobacter cryaerophilus ATCC 43158]|uniref:Multi-sensor domain-containing response regulator c-di-GMP phosphodiesterase, RpfG family n=1 Tax=Aliarcobacter cryaerophilus ATCC 43158 TaxID=1032070 RepID=A0AAD0XAQ6_9BACT|nr:HD domain-containing phosphohydrolase [Aliarcobacter cryaerophilus]AYJ80366.1 multi-sensor domain-containing response regulator c-di-GMP phosphodiesterase, RpfG family [Aliarcobacter cryaerophilus ATCC 43158]PRM98777.1 response regulator receiver protein [Aliarcobacter cryaerophilus]QCZ24578.1 response regulator receiver protein [Aliarcobacter cryaerophilus ATCC 43158]
MKKILYFVIGFLALVSISYYFYYSPKKEDITKEIFLEKSNQMRKLFTDEIKRKQDNTLNMAFILSQDENLINALKTKNKSLLNYDNTLLFLHDNSEYKNLWLQIVDKDGRSFYRSWRKITGDDLSNVRTDLEELIKNPKPTTNISSGLFDLTLKAINPIYDLNGEFLGFVEFISKFNSISKNLKFENIEPIFILSKEKSEKIIEPFSKIFIRDNYIVNIDADKTLLKFIEKKGIDTFLNIENYLLMDKFIITNLEIKDVNGSNMGLFLLFFEKNRLDYSPLANFKNQYLSIVIIFSILYLIGFLYLLKTIYAKELDDDVKIKTKMIQEQQKKLEKLLDIYDKNVIFSRTDLKGIITHASSAFCKISGYSKNELLGQPHNIVRHPDMPKSIFKKIWDSLKDEKKITIELKNLRKDGSYYWVVADLEPEYDDLGNHIGYFAVREDITANKEIEELQKEVIFTMGSIAEFRSKETGEHIKRVAKYSKILATAYGLCEDEVDMLELASPMHDIGKIAIPDAILNKPGKLTDEEFDIIKTHAQKGHDMLGISNRPLFKVASQIALSHHEKYDGTGYPNNLKAENIPIFGRITALADVFDALGSDRCYKKAWDIEKVFEFIKEQKGKHFDPKLVELFFENIDQILKIRDDYKDI